MAKAPNQTAKNETGDFAQFTSFMRRLVSVPHSEIQERLKAEKKSSASRVPASGKKAR
jgi:hypothetical protein